MILKSTFKDGKRLPDNYCNFGTLGGLNISPMLKWEGHPAETKSFALSMIDNHPVAKHFVHWLIADIPVGIARIDERASMTGQMPDRCVELLTSYKTPGYGGARPPSGTGNHEYETTLYALSIETLSLDRGSDFTQFEEAIAGKVLEMATIIGVYSQ